MQEYFQSTHLREVSGEKALPDTSLVFLGGGWRSGDSPLHSFPVEDLRNCPSGRTNQFDQTLKFQAHNSSEKVRISPTGLMASCYAEKDNLLLANKAFSHGKVYWEFIAPSDCGGMQMGVTSSQDTKSLLVQSFRTTTPRIIGN